MTRRRITGTPRIYQAVFQNLSNVQRTLFDGFFDEDLAGGTLAFAWRDPIDGDLALWRIRGDGDTPYSMTSKGAALHDLSLTLLRLPGVPWWAPYGLAGDNRAPYVVADYQGGVYGVAGQRTAAAAVALVAGTFDLFTTDGATTAELAHVVAAGDIPATAPGTVTKIVGFVPE
ncbi:MAG: hypothetical protein MUE98_00175 [Rhodobacteraceae bacterium]|nr:hypothetical protein [Paracoccaceae bacterium]